MYVIFKSKSIPRLIITTAKELLLTSSFLTTRVSWFLSFLCIAISQIHFQHRVLQEGHFRGAISWLPLAYLMYVPDSLTVGATFPTCCTFLQIRMSPSIHIILDACLFTSNMAALKVTVSLGVNNREMKHRTTFWLSWEKFWGHLI